MPLAAPGVFTTAIIAFFIALERLRLRHLADVDQRQPAPCPPRSRFFTGASQFEQPTGAISAAAVVVTIPVVILVLIFQRQIVAGLTQGAVKG